MLPPYLQPRGTLAPQVPSILSVLRGGAASPMGALGYPTPPAGSAAPGLMDQFGSKMLGKLGDEGADNLLGLLKNGGLKSLLGGDTGPMGPGTFSVAGALPFASGADFNPSAFFLTPGV